MNLTFIFTILIIVCLYDNHLYNPSCDEHFFNIHDNVQCTDDWKICFFYTFLQNTTFLLWNNNQENNKVVYFRHENNILFIINYLPCSIYFVTIFRYFWLDCLPYWKEVHHGGKWQIFIDVENHIKINIFIKNNHKRKCVPVNVRLYLISLMIYRKNNICTSENKFSMFTVKWKRSYNILLS